MWQLAGADLQNASAGAVRDLVASEVTLQRLKMVEVYRIVRVPGAPPQVSPIIDVASPTLPRSSRATADRLAARVATGSGEPRSLEPRSARRTDARRGGRAKP